MILRRLRVQHFRRIDRGVEVTFDPEINLIVGPNESGKSSLVLAIPFALFTSYRVTGAALKEVFPFGRALSPTIEMEIELRGKRYRIFKRFHSSSQSLVEEIQEDGTRRPLAEGEEADRWMSQIFEAQLPKRFRGFPTQWGVARALWLLQGPEVDPAPWVQPQALRQSVNVTTEASSWLRLLLESVEADLFTQLTKEKLQSKKHGELERLREEIHQLQDTQRELEQALSDLRQRQRELQEIQKRREEKAKAETRIQQRLQELHQQIQEVRGLKEQQKTLQLEIARLSEKAHALEQRVERARKTWEAYQNLQKRLEKLKRRRQETEESLEHLQRKLRRLEDEQQQMEERLRSQEKTLADLRKLEAIQRARQERETLEQQLQQVERRLKQREEIHRALQGQSSEELQQLLEEWHQANERLARAQARLEGLRMRLRLQTLQEVDLQVNHQPLHLPAGETWETLTTPGFTLEIPGMLRITLEAAGRELQALHQEIQDLQAKQRSVLQRAGVSDLQGLKDRWTQVQRLEFRLERLRQELQELPDPETLQQKLARLRLQLQDAPQEVPPAEELRLQIQEAEQEQARTQRDLRALQSQIQDLRQQLNDLRTVLAKVSREEAAHQTQVDSHWERLLELLEGFWPGGQAMGEEAVPPALAALERQQRDLLDQLQQRQNALQNVQKRLPPQDPEEEAQRLEARRQQLQEEQRDLRDRYVRTEAALEHLRAQDLELKLQETQLRLKRRQERLRHLQIHLEALLLLRKEAEGLLQRMENALASFVGQRVEEYLRFITGVERRVWLNQGQWYVSFPGDSNPPPLGLKQAVSSGTLEQFALSLRLAYGTALAERLGRQLVILDDALVFSDDERFQRILSLLHQLRDRLQIVILTTHPERYELLEAHEIPLQA